ncbi:M16 family metallopeptidase [Vibrio algarum]|uniref:Insulinase family protein n=1 Tax=Vibrio algarum TaxID=3020714 RepID=A0ABT4YWM5_9VIBR|nr:insulinase family protein [Vibrio sp. KJ40-1]MDB1125792.1 insulinase family protein [Vibrio sp. KJ40-1]
MLIKTIFTSIFISAFSLIILGCTNPTLKSSRDIIQDPHWHTQELDNGLKYHLYYLEGEPIEMRMLVKVGSYHEDLTQLGYAHFLEHMAFNGSKHFKDNQLIEQFEHEGVTFGADLNAYTDYEVTSYQMSLPNNNKIDEALTWFRDIGDGLTLSPEQIEREKGVVLGEFRVTNTNEVPLYNQIYDELIEESGLGSYDPLGSEDHIITIDKNKLTRFYNKWYHPNNTEIIIVGDISHQNVKQKIEDIFSDWKSNPIPKTSKVQLEHIKSTGSVAFAIPTSDPASITLLQPLGRSEERTRLDQQNLLNYIFAYQAIHKRLDTKAYEKSLNIESIYADYFDLYQIRYGEITLGFSEKNREKTQTFLANELANLRDQGLSQSEFSTVLMGFKNVFDEMETEHHNRTSQEVIDEKENSVLTGNPYQSFLDKKESFQQFLTEVSLTKTNETLNKILSTEHQKIALGTPVLLESLDFAKFPVNRYSDAFNTIFLQKSSEKPTDITNKSLSISIANGNVVAFETVKEQLHKWTLENGIEVWLNQSEQAENNVFMNYISEGGLLSVNNQFNPAYYLFLETLQQSGITGLSVTELQTNLINNATDIYPFFDINTHGFQIDTRLQYLNNAFTLLHLSATDAQIDSKQFHLIKNRIVDERTNLQNSSIDAYYSDLQKEQYGENSARADSKPNEIAAVTAGSLEELYHLLFRTDYPFRLIIAANITPEELTPYLEKYVANIRFDAKQHNNQRITIASHKTELERATSNEDSVLYGIYFSEQSTIADSKESVVNDLIYKIIDSRYYKLIREEKGLDYSPTVGLNKMDGSNIGEIWFEMTLDPNDVEIAKKAMQEFLDHLLTNGITENELQTAKKQVTSDIEKNDSVTDKLDKLTRYLTFDYSLDAYNNPQSVIDSITIDDLNKRIDALIGADSHRINGYLRPIKTKS